VERIKKVGNRIFALLFVLALLAFSGANFLQTRELLKTEAAPLDPAEISKGIAELNAVLEENVLGRYQMLEGYGRIQKLLDKHEENAFVNVIDKAGYLYSGNFWNGFGDDQKELAVRVRRLSDFLKERGVPLGFVLEPSKTVRAEERYAGIPYDDFTTEADDMLRWLRYYGVPYLDLRESMERSGLDYDEMWFKTDHHWTPPAAFEGYRALVSWMNEVFGAGLDPDGVDRDLDHYDVVTYPDAMLGSQGRETGLAYAGGMEDYTAVAPKAEGSYVWISNDAPMRSGAFREAFLKEDILGMDPYHLNAGAFYLNELTVYSRLINRQAPNDKKILLLRDSFATPVGAFLAQDCARVDMLWNIEYTADDLRAYLEENDLDYVIIMLYPQNLSNGSFPFFQTAGQEDL